MRCLKRRARLGSIPLFQMNLADAVVDRIVVRIELDARLELRQRVGVLVLPVIDTAEVKARPKQIRLDFQRALKSGDSCLQCCFGALQRVRIAEAVKEGRVCFTIRFLFAIQRPQCFQMPPFFPFHDEVAMFFGGFFLLTQHLREILLHVRLPFFCGESGHRERENE